jgi:LPXTG-site transpeptidase (sortase) family protein
MTNKILYFLLGLAIIAVSLLQTSSIVAWGEDLLSQRQAETTQPIPQHLSETPPSLSDNAQFMPLAIQIEDIDLSLKIISSPLVNGTWQVYDGVANFAEGTSIVNTQEGNVGLFAHDRANGFTRIKELDAGDTITLTGSRHQATYEIVTKKILKPSDVQVFNPTTEPTLTLITCDGLFSEKRYMVQAKLKAVANYE